MNRDPIDFRISLDETHIIKGIAICAMLIHHLFYNSAAYGFFTQQFGIVCKVCVSMFLFVSGYGLTIQYSKSHNRINAQSRFIFTIKFLLKRFYKFYLNYWIIFAIVVPIGVFVLKRPLSAAYGTETGIWLNLSKDILGVQGFDSYIITWWFNALIISLYLLFPTLYWFMNKRIIAIGMITLLLLWPRDYIVGNFFYIFELWNSNLMVYSLVFTLGIATARHANFLNKILNKIRVWQVFILSTSIAIALCFIRQLLAENFAEATTIDAFITIFSVLSITSLRRQTRLQMKVPIILGKHSMNIYLIHTFILMYFFPNFIIDLKISLLTFIALLTESLSLSALLEFIKKKIGFYKLYL